MVDTDDAAPEFEATLANGEVESFSLEAALEEGPVVLAFFPGAFTPPCSNEMVALQDHSDDFTEAGVRLLGVSADSPFALNAFRDEYDLTFDLVSDTSRGAIQQYGLETDIADLGLYGVANRAVYVLDETGRVQYAWEAESPEHEPKYEELAEAVAGL